MRITWPQQWLRRRLGHRTPSLGAAVSRWTLAHKDRRDGRCACAMEHTAILAPHLVPLQRTVITLRHHLDVNLVTQYLERALHCDEWDVRCRNGHQVVVCLTRGGGPAYHVSYECSPAVEKAICHGHRAWALTLTPVAGENNLSPGEVAELKAGLAGLYG